jgi:uncharacterized protein
VTDLEERLKYPLFGQAEPARMIQIPDYPFDHQVRVWLPPSYPYTDRLYPVLWVTDNMLEVAAAAMMGSSLRYAPDVILVAVGGATDLPMVEFQRRRIYDYSPEYGEMRSQAQQYVTPDAVGGVKRFRDYLIDELRPQLADEYRMDPADHGLAGHSGGGMFTLYTLLTRAEEFTKYLVSSPGNAVCDFRHLEAQYAETHSDLKARVFIAAGGIDMTDYLYANLGVWSSTAEAAEALATRGYPSLELVTAVLPGYTHFSVWPIIYTEGVRALWPEHLSLFSRSDTEIVSRTQKEWNKKVSGPE